MNAPHNSEVLTEVTQAAVIEIPRYETSDRLSLDGETTGSAGGLDIYLVFLPIEAG